MWTKNGAETLPVVLKRISKVIPSESVNKQVIVDDRSTDNTREIAKSFGWDVVLNEGKGISDGANTALKHVTSTYFISFEQDILLTRDWWEKVPGHLSEPEVAVASGVRFSNQPPALRSIQEYALERYRRSKDRIESFLCGKTLDNTIYKTKVIRRIGGFPRISRPAGMDAVLALQLHQNHFKWKVDDTVRSVHLRKGLRDELTHYYWYGLSYEKERDIDILSLGSRLFFSPLRGLGIAIKRKAPQAVYIYPLIRFVGLKGIFDGRKR
jgi:glycosyltransferase involved in cell wall biosynthesis